MPTNIHPLCDDTTLWEQVYRYALRHCHQHADAEDLTQDVFCRLLRSGALLRYRSGATNEPHLLALLRTTTRRLWSNSQRAAHAEKRRGWVERVPLDTAGDQTGFYPSRTTTDESAYRALEQVASEAEASLEQEYRRRGDQRLFESLRDALIPDPSGNPTCYATMARRTRRSEGALRTAVSRARNRFRELVRQELAQRSPAPPISI